MIQREKKGKIYWKILMIGGVIGILFFVLVGSWALQSQRKIADDVLRLHIVANSDRTIDQNLKLSVRDKILTECGYLFAYIQNASQATETARYACNKIRQVAERELRRQGVLYPVTVTVEETSFPTKAYGEISLPAGRYQALQVRLGAATGQNWWCVLYPPLCLTGDAVKADTKTLDLLRSKLSDREYAMVTQTDEIHIKTQFYLLEKLREYFPFRS